MAGDDPLGLTRITLLLPSRRACRTVREAFLRIGAGKPVLLPRLQPMGDVDADDIAVLWGDAPDAGFFDMPPAIGKLQRQVLLARLIMQTGRAAGFDQAAALALDLGRFLDEMQTSNISFDKLDTLVPDVFSAHWQETLDFLKILTAHWPQIVSGAGYADQAARRNALLEAQIRLWEENPPADIVIAAGTVAPIPMLRRLLKAVSRLPQGMVVLPGLDLQLDDDAFGQLGEDHPQYHLRRLLGELDIARTDVQPWPETPVVNTARLRLLSEVMRPAATTDRWRALSTHGDIGPAALQGMTRIDCKTPQHEADVIALILREVLETPSKTAALVTPDRRLARRVSQSLARWGIKIDDSGGQPLTESPVGSWLMLTAEMAAENLAPVSLLAVLKHPFMAAALPPEVLRRAVYVLDALVLRGPRPAAGIDGLRHAIATLEGGAEVEKKDLLAWLDQVAPLISDFVDRMNTAAGKPAVPAAELLRAHIDMAEALAATATTTGAGRLWRGEAGHAANEVLKELLAAAVDVPPLHAAEYTGLLYTLLKGITVRPAYGAHPRLEILGLIEARLHAADLVVLGGVNEGSWPELPGHDPWLSRPMRRSLGLLVPEAELSLSAHDFVSGAAMPEVVITRAEKQDGTPTVPARWLLRLEAVLSAAGLDMPQTAARRYLQWVEDLDRPEHIAPALRPAACPPVHVRPRQLSVTRIETWMRDPYQIYAQYILGLSPLDPIDADPGGAERGTFIHAALEAFVKKYPVQLPDHAEEELLAIGRQALLEHGIPPEVEAYWWPRFARSVAVYIVQERRWRETGARPVITEMNGRLQLERPGGPFTLTAKADRIDKMADGTYAIIDYKTGQTPQPKALREGISPQLPLEALMLEKGAFEKVTGSVAAQAVSDMLYWKITGSGRMPVEQISMVKSADDLRLLIAEAEAGLAALIDRFDDPAQAYISQPRAAAKPRFSDYEHLARVREWSVGTDEGEEAA